MSKDPELEKARGRLNDAQADLNAAVANYDDERKRAAAPLAPGLDLPEVRELAAYHRAVATQQRAADAEWRAKLSAAAIDAVTAAGFELTPADLYAPARGFQITDPTLGPEAVDRATEFAKEKERARDEAAAEVRRLEDERRSSGLLRTIRSSEDPREVARAQRELTDMIPDEAPAASAFTTDDLSVNPGTATKRTRVGGDGIPVRVAPVQGVPA